jgi:hypothetical protein
MTRKAIFPPIQVGLVGNVNLNWPRRGGLIWRRLSGVGGALGLAVLR